MYQVIQEVVLGFQHFEKSDDPMSVEHLIRLRAYSLFASKKLESVYEQDLHRKIERKQRGANFI